MKRKSIALASAVLTLIVTVSTVFGTPAILAERTTVAPYKTEAPKEQKQAQPNQVFVIDNFRIIQRTLEKLGVPPSELDQMIREGKNLRQVLEIKKISIKKFKKCVLKEYYAVINEGVKNKQITETQGEMLRKAIKEKVMGWLTNK